MTATRAAQAVDSLTVRSFRALRQVTIPRFGQVNLIIGENGAGKTSLLEALWLLCTGDRRFALAEIARMRDDLHGAVPPPGVRSAIETPSGSRVNLHRADVEDSRGEPCGAVFLSSQGLTVEQRQQLWTRVSLTTREDLVADVMRRIFPSIIRVAIVPSTTPSTVVMARVQGENQPVPLRTLGEGASRVFDIGLALAAASGGVLLVDEIENGLHYAAQRKVWDFIVEAAPVLNTQVFASTHSSDTLRAFQQATRRNPNVEGLVTRLRRFGDEVEVTQFDEDELEVVVREAIEVR